MTDSLRSPSALTRLALALPKGEVLGAHVIIIAHTASPGADKNLSRSSHEVALRPGSFYSDPESHRKWGEALLASAALS